MAATIKLKNSVTSSSSPSSLAQGEVALNITDKKLWVGNASSTPVQLLGDGADVKASTLITSGNVGVGVTPSAWSGSYKAIEVGGLGSSIFGQTAGNNTWVTANAYFNGSNWIRPYAAAASAFNLSSGTAAWYIAGSSTAGSTITFTQAMTLDASGNLLVGSTTSISKVNIGASFGSSYPSYSNPSSGGFNGGFFSSANNSSDGYRTMLDIGAVTANTDGTSGGSVVRFLTQPRTSPYALVEAARIDSSGRLLVGQTSGTEIFCVTSPNSGNYAANITNSSGTNPNGLVINTPNKAGNAGLYGLTVANSGGNAFAIYTNGTYGTISDINRKKNVETARDGYLTDLCALRVVKYNWNEQEDDEPKELGFIAQEIEQVFAGLVQTDGNGQKMVKQPVFIPMLIKSIQELKTIVDAQASEIAALKGQA